MWCRVRRSSILLEGVAAGTTVVVGPFKVLEKLKDGDTVVDERDAEKAKASKVGDAEKKSGVEFKVGCASVRKGVCA